MASGRRLTVLVVALALVGAPAVALRALCVGKSCAQEDIAAAAPVPFCPLPAALREQIVAGYRQGRSPDVMGTTNASTLVRGWPASPYRPDANLVPIAFFGAGVLPGSLPPGTGVDQIAPTLEGLMGFDRSHPEVRNGQPIDGIVRASTHPRLIVEIVWTDDGSTFSQTHAPRLLDTLGSSGEAASGEATTGSMPVDPAAILTSIGTGGIPAEHGITGRTIRSAEGAAVAAWGPDAPTSIIATLADDWDHATDERARIGLIAPDATAQGIVGGTWYLEHDRDDLVFGDGDPVEIAASLVRSGFGADAISDILAVVLDGGALRMDAQTRALVRSIRELVPDTTFVLTATGPGDSRSEDGRSTVSVGSVVRGVNAAIGASVVASAVAGGLFLEQDVMAANEITSDQVIRAMESLKAPGGGRLFADAYPGFAVGFSRYC